MFKRMFLFVLTNILVMVTVSMIMAVLGVGNYLTAAGINYSALMVFCLIWGFVGSGISLLMSKWMAKRMMGVEIVDERGPYVDLVRKVHQMARQAGINKMPEVGVYQSPEVNAFATGPSKNNALVAVSSGLLQQMNSDEVEGVLAHEVAHVANGDMVTMALVQGVVNAFVMFFARIAAFALQNVLSGDSDEDRPQATGGFAYHISVMVFEIAFSFLGMFVVAYFSRVREFRADKGGAQYAGKHKMVAALRRLQQKIDMVDDSQDAIKTMKITSKKGLMNFLSTHPSLEDRIAALERSH
ncbi:MAG TPA: protease HtpX [Bacteriovoracaceae bacterium]|nr:protease HtpX [Bacteriovoracaceae bacterium]